MKILVTGKGGQLAWELEQTKPDNITLVSFDANELDITKKQDVFDAFKSEQPDIVINAAAYTAVDKAETDSEAAYAVNEKGSRFLAEACKEYNVKLIHVSTDFVFDGKQTTPYSVDAEPLPLNVYGESKLKGDLAVNEVLGSDATIIRTAWVYSANGNNFVKTMLRLMAEKPELGVIYDQVGTPTWAKGLAKLIWALTEKNDRFESPTSRILHWTDAGVASWYDFAVAIQEIGLEKGILTKAIPIKAVPTSHYPLPARRPSFSVIDKASTEAYSGVQTRHWRTQLSEMIEEIKMSHC
ncbi:dTDP-4-dehydrorhamnose reductase [Vibrio variabilis]|uniref:dTDP-4-dehydrorhamnose reductase n=1 Tax=Vibrio variabilis TaxID=990271 RepID=A0ABQ0J619_9VIBR|nr:dTDP-4-dehydrorhamnose reductase [Vibrio variabilis]